MASLAALAWTMLALGCHEPRDAAAQPASSSSSSTAGSAPVASTGSGSDAGLEAYYIVPPSAARQLDYRIAWQAITEPFNNSGVKMMTVQGDSIFVLDGQNYLTRVRRDDGDRTWRLAIAEAVEDIQGITFVPEIGRVFVLNGGELLVLDAASGAQITKHRLRQVAETSAAVYGNELIYGSHSGQLVWHEFMVGQSPRAYQIASQITVPPIVHDDAVVAVGSGGHVAVINAASASMIWNVKLLDSVVAPPAVGNNAVYVAGLDQHVWAYDIRNGRRLWRYLTESPLREPPLLLGKRLYQNIPTEGMVCFDAVVKDSPGGKVIWKSPAAVAGHGIGEHKGILWVWDPANTDLTLLSAARGHVTGAVDLPRIKHLELSSTTSGELYAASNNGQIIRLDPR